MGEFRYKAFISYSWSDARWGKWLHHAVETYRTPKALVGQDRGHGPVPARLHPLFKDREEEAAGSSIGAAVEAALADSEFLIVVCSPNSAQSQWVNREIAWFKTHRSPDKILALIVGGEPGHPEQECFPKALTHEVDPDMTVTDRPLDKPLAADARETGDGKRMARLKIAAAMLGVGLDELVRRDERRRTLRTRAVVAASLTLAAVMSTLTWFAVEARKEAEFQRNEADGLVEFMLTDLRDKLEPVGRLDALDVVGKRALDYYARQKLGDLDADALGRRARALLLVGEITNIRGDSEAALKAFTQAAATTGEQLARDPDNEQRIFDHAQSVFWVGYIAYNRGELENAETQFRDYKRLADRLIELDPNDPKWQMESSYAESNLGAMYDQQFRFAEAERAFANGLKQIDAVAAGEPWNADRLLEVGTTVNWLGKAKSGLGKESEALKLHEREIAIYREVLSRQPTNAAAKNRLAVAMQFLGDVAIAEGKLDQGIAAYQQSLALNAELRRIEPDNTEWQQSAVGAHLKLSRYLMYAQSLGDGDEHLKQASRLLAVMIAKDRSNATWAVEFRLQALMIKLKLDLASGRAQQGWDEFQNASSWVEDEDIDIDPLIHTRLLMLLGDTQQRLGKAGPAQQYWQDALERAPNIAAADLDKYLLNKRLGRNAERDKYAKVLDGRGFRHPAYLKER